MYSPLRPKHPYVRGVLLEMYREARERLGDPVEAWASIVDDPERARAYKSQRGKGGFLRASWDEAAELIAAAHVHTIRRYGPDRIAGFSPIPAMSMVSYTAGHPLPLADRRRMPLLLRLVRGPAARLAADLGRPDRRPRVGRLVELLLPGPLGLEHPPDADPRRPLHDRGPLPGPEGGRRVPRLRRPHQVRRPLAAAEAGTDGALAMAMGHVILKEFYVGRRGPYFCDYARRYTDMPMLVTLREREDGSRVADTFLRASDLGEAGENAEWMTVVYDVGRGEAVAPNGSIGFRWGEQGAGRWNLDLGEVDPALTCSAATTSWSR